MRGDKFFIWIVIGVVLLVVVAFIVVLARPEETYKAEDTPDSIVYNYLLAVEKGDYERALSYFSETVSYPPEDVDEFADHLDHRRCSWKFGDLDRDHSIFIEPAVITGTRARVTVQQTIYYRDVLFRGGQYQDDFQMRLKLEDNDWKLIGGDNYWCECWSEKDNSCPGQ